MKNPMSALSRLLNSRKKRLIALVSAFAAVALVLYWAWGRSAAGVPAYDEAQRAAFAKYIHSHSSGLVKSGSSIFVQFHAGLVDTAAAEARADKLLQLDPAVGGTARWKDAQTLEFIPNEPLQNGKSYQVSLALGKLLALEEADLQTYVFGVHVVPLRYELETEVLRLNEAGDTYQLAGKIRFTDVVDPQKAEKMLDVRLGGNALEVRWESGAEEARFVIPNIPRGSAMRQLLLAHNGEVLGMAEKGELEMEIPGRNTFGLLNIRMLPGEETVVQVVLSDPPAEGQDLRGLVLLDGAEGVSYQRDGNVLLLYPGKLAAGKHTVDLHQALRSDRGITLNGKTRLQFGVDNQIPALRPISKGSILPTAATEVVYAFEAMNLQSVLLEVYEIPAHKVQQHLQQNDLQGNYELYRVARPKVVRTLSLSATGQLALNRWNKFSVNLADYLPIKAGAMYQLRIRFGRHHLLYPCKGSATVEILTDAETLERLNDTYDDMYGDYWDRDGGWNEDDQWDWSQRDNPCNRAFYEEDRFLRTNILVSQLGVVAKRGNDGHAWIWVQQLGSTDAVEGVQVQLLDFQGNEIAAGKTDGDGLVKLQPDGKPFLAVVQNGTDRAYLRLDDGSSLSVSDFDVSGNNIQKGLKGFAYGERGVWRPGDSIYLSFMLEDRQKRLPERYPVVMELRNPKGQLIDRQVNNQGLRGLYQFVTRSRSDAMTGAYTARFKAGGATFEKSVRIESIKPNRLKIETSLGENDTLRLGSQVPITLKVRYLSGATAAGLRATYDLVLRPAKTAFKGFIQYQFDDPAVQFNGSEEVFFDGRLDESGQVEMPLRLPASLQSPGAVQATFKGKVFEPGGDFSIDQFSLLLYPYTAFAGMKWQQSEQSFLDVGQTHPINLVNVGAGGRLQAGKVQVTVYKLDWDWWWQSGSENLASYIEQQSYNVLHKAEVNLAGGKGRYDFKPNAGWGRYYIRVKQLESGHSTGTVVYADEPYWAGRRTQSRGGASRLAMRTDKTQYKPGETIKLQLPSPGKATLLLTVENGSTVLASSKHELRSGDNTIELPVTANMAPNVYLFASLIQPYLHPDNEAPLRQYGVVPVLVEDPASRLQPMVQVPADIRPEQSLKVTVGEKSGKGMAYTLAVVDEGLLSLTRFKTPDPHKAFFAREALGVRTWDVYDEVIGAYGAGIDRLLALGGDQELQPADDGSGLRFKPVVKVLGPFYLKPGAKTTHQVPIPNYLGELRVMVVAAGEGAYGSTQAATRVNAPVMLLGSLPRMLHTSESMLLPVNVFNTDKKTRKITVNAQSSGLAKIQGAASKVVEVAAGKSALVYFNLATGASEGEVKITLQAVSGADQFTERTDLRLTNVFSKQSKVEEVVVAPGETFEKSLSYFGQPGTNTTRLEVAGEQPVFIEQRLQELLQYPHGCLEQTVSTAYAQLYLPDLVRLNEADLRQLQQRMQMAIEKVSAFQLPEGGFSYWPGQTTAEAWVTSYAGLFLLSAKNAGYRVNEEVLQRWKSYQTNQARVYTATSARVHAVQAYRLYALASARQPEAGAMNRLREELGANDRQSIAWLAGAYALAGQELEAANLLRKMSIPTSLAAQSEDDYSYFGSAFRNAAVLVRAYQLAGMRSEAAKLMALLKVQFNSSDYLSTQENAQFFVALKGQGNRSVELKFDFEAGGSGKQNINSSDKLWQQRLELQVGKKQLVRLKNTGNSAITVRLVQQGKPAAGKEMAYARGLDLKVRLLNRDGSEIKTDSLPQGSLFTAEITVTNLGQERYPYMALQQLLPPGLELVNQRLGENLGFGSNDGVDYQDLRDDRLLSYFALEAGRSFSIRIPLSATYAGKFYWPGVSCENMYGHAPAAVRKGKWLTIVPQR